MHLNSELLFNEYAAKHFSKGQRVLEIGPHGYPSYYKKLLGIEDIEWHTLDISLNDIAGGEQNPLHITSKSEYNYPIESNIYDVIITGQVMEHVKKIWLWIEELKRITKKNGLIIIVVPVSWPYHAVPVDCWRIFPEGMRALLDGTGLEILECKFDSLEKTLLPKSTPSFPGDETINYNRQVSKKTKLIFMFNRIVSVFPLLRKFSISVSVAYDTICIARKN